MGYLGPFDNMTKGDDILSLLAALEGHEPEAARFLGVWTNDHVGFENGTELREVLYEII